MWRQARDLQGLFSKLVLEATVLYWVDMLGIKAIIDRTININVY